MNEQISTWLTRLDALSAGEVGAFGAALEALGRRGVEGDQVAHADFHSVLYDLHERRDPETYATRRWLASRCHQVMDAEVPPLEYPECLESAAFVERFLSEFKARSGLRHPLSAFLFDGQPSMAQVKVYLRHQWHRSRSFWRELAELSLSLPLEQAALLYRNLYDETGAAGQTPGHPTMFQVQLRHLGLPCGVDDRPWLYEAHRYLNNRYRCAQHRQPEWGLGVLFSIEYGTPATHGAIYRLLQRMGVDEAHLEFHRTHITADEAHTADLITLVTHFARTRDTQATVLRALRFHRQLGNAYFDRIFEEVQRVGPG